MDAQHTMQLTATHASGAEEWSCPACGRRFLLQWPPWYRKIVLEPGDQLAQHSCSKGGLIIGTPSFTAYDPDALPGEDGAPFADATDLADADAADTLQPWLRWLNTADLDAHFDESA